MRTVIIQMGKGAQDYFSFKLVVVVVKEEEQTILKGALDIQQIISKSYYLHIPHNHSVLDAELSLSDWVDKALWNEKSKPIQTLHITRLPLYSSFS